MKDRGGGGGGEGRKTQRDLENRLRFVLSNRRQAEKLRKGQAMPIQRTVGCTECSLHVATSARIFWLRKRRRKKKEDVLSQR